MPPGRAGARMRVFALPRRVRCAPGVGGWNCEGFPVFCAPAGEHVYCASARETLMVDKGETVGRQAAQACGSAMIGAVREALDDNASFGDLLSRADRQFLLDHAVVRRAVPGEQICHRHQRDNRVFIIVVGEVEVTESVDGEVVRLATLRRGELFGEIAALFNSPRLSTVTATRSCVLLELRGEVLDGLIERLPALRDAVVERYRFRITEAALRAVPLFSGLPDDALQALREQASLLSVPTGGHLLEEGEPGEALFVVIFGLARVCRVVDDQAINLAILRPGDYFGEWSLLTGAPRAASVAALTRLQVLRIDCRLFLEFIQNNPEVRDRIDLVAYNRRAQAAGGRPCAESAAERDRLLAEMDNITRSERRTGPV